MRFHVGLCLLTLLLSALPAAQTPAAQDEPAKPATQEPPKPDQDEQKEPAFEDEVTVVASTRTGRRVEDEPIRVEVVPQEEIDEKVFMTPGDISMMLTETNGLRVQVTSPSLGAASVRVQGLRGRYTQVLSDGLPLFGPPGTIGILQIPPMDLAQVEVIKGVASALYGGAALGGVINLITRQPQRDKPEREVLINRTSRGGTDGVLWLAKRGEGNWGYTFLGGGHFQDRNDIDRDGWTDLPTYRRATARPRVMWEDGSGRSVFFTVGGMAEERRGGSMPGHTAPDGQPFPEKPDNAALRRSIVARLPSARRAFSRCAARGLASGISTRSRPRRSTTSITHGSAKARLQARAAAIPGCWEQHCNAMATLRASCRRSATTTWCQASSRRTTSPSPAGLRSRPARAATFTTSSETSSVRESPRWSVRRPAGLPGFQQAPVSWRRRPSSKKPKLPACHN